MFGWLPVLPTDWPGWLASVATYVNDLPTNPENQFYFFRFALGFFEGGFFPSVIVYLTYWFRAEDRAKAVASFMAAIPLSSAFGLPISGLLLPVNWFGLSGWRWIFILEGLLPIAAGVAVLWFLPNRPKDARWLPEDEREWLQAELDREHRAKQGHFEWVHHLGMVALLTGVYFCLNVASYGLSMFMPAIIKSQLHSTNDTLATIVASLPYFMALIGMLVNGWHSDRTGERIWHVATPLAFSSLGIFLAAMFDGVPVVPVLLMIFVVGTCLYAHQPAFWPIPSVFLGAAAAASAIGFINMFGNLGGFFGPNMVGSASDVVPVSAPADKTSVGGKADDKAMQTPDNGKQPFTPSPLENSGGPLASSGQGAGKGPEANKTVEPPRFRTALLRLAPWPITASVVILIVGYVRRRRLAAPPPDDRAA